MFLLLFVFLFSLRIWTILFFWGFVHFKEKRNHYKITLLLICLSVKTTLTDIELKFIPYTQIYSPMISWKKNIFLKKKIWPFISQENAYFDIIKRIKINRVLLVNLELLNLAVKKYTFVVKSAAISNEASNERALAKLRLNFSQSSRPPIFVRNPIWACPTLACPILLFKNQIKNFVMYLF